jgi:hypothetical protein
MVTLSCSVHKLNIIFRISGLVFHFSLLLWPPIVVVLTNYNRGSYASRNSYKTPRQPLTFCIFSSSASGRSPSNHQSNDVDLQLVNANHSPGTFIRLYSSRQDGRHLRMKMLHPADIRIIFRNGSVSQLDGNLWHWSTPSALFGIFIHLYDYDFIP